MSELKVLIVRHGRCGRPHSRYMQRSLTQLKQQRPDLHRRLVFHHTGEPTPGLDGIGAIVFWLRCPLRVHRACYDDAVRIAEEARRKSIPLINSPYVLSDLSKSRQGRLWREAGIPTPEVERFETLESLRKAAERLVYPIVLRGDQTHRQRDIHIVGDPGELRALSAAQLTFPCAVSPFIDVRVGYSAMAPKSAYARLFHKKRLIVANGVIRTKHIMFSSSPIVGAQTSIFRQAERFGRFETPFLLWPLHRECVQHDLSYWRQEEEHGALMLKARNALGLQFAAIDYSSLSDGRPILWEANAYFEMPNLKDIMLPRRRRAAERLITYQEAIGTFLSELLMALGETPAVEDSALSVTAGQKNLC